MGGGQGCVFLVKESWTLYLACKTGRCNIRGRSRVLHCAWVYLTAGYRILVRAKNIGVGTHAEGAAHSIVNGETGALYLMSSVLQSGILRLAGTLIGMRQLLSLVTFKFNYFQFAIAVHCRILIGTDQGVL